MKCLEPVGKVTNILQTGASMWHPFTGLKQALPLTTTMPTKDYTLHEQGPKVLWAT